MELKAPVFYREKSQRLLLRLALNQIRHRSFIEQPDGKKEKVRIKNRRSDFLLLKEKLQSHNIPVDIGLEPTCSFHRNFVHYFKSSGFTVLGISTLALARTREALHNSWDKNDPKDAAVMLHLLKQNQVQVMTEPALAGFNHLQELSKTHSQICLRKPNCNIVC